MINFWVVTFVSLSLATGVALAQDHSGATTVHSESEAPSPAAPAPPVVLKPEEKTASYSLATSGGKTPVITIFNKTYTQRTIAQSLNSAAKTAETDPKRKALMKTDNKIEITFAGLRVRRNPVQDGEVFVTLVGASGEFELPRPILLSHLESGEVIKLSLPHRTQSLAGLSVDGKGQLQIQWNAKTRAIDVVYATGQLTVASPLGELFDSGSLSQIKGKRDDTLPARPVISP